MPFKKKIDNNEGETQQEKSKVTELKVVQGRKPLQLTPEQMDMLKEELKEYDVIQETKESRDPKFQKVAEALISTGGFISKTATKLGISYQRLRKIIDKNPKLKEIIVASNEAFVDLAENKLKIAVAKGESWAVIFALKCKGASRGYREDGSGAIEHQLIPVFNYEVSIPENFEIVPKKEAVG